MRRFSLIPQSGMIGGASADVKLSQNDAKFEFGLLAAILTTME
jgi:hypothetical protein